MNPFHLLKALLISMREGFRHVPPGAAATAPRFKPQRKPLPPFPVSLKWLFTLLFVAGAATFIALRWQESQPQGPPAWFHTETHSRPSLPIAPVKLLREACETEAAKTRLPLASLRMLVLADTNHPSVTWATEPAWNPGFNSITKVERQFPRRRDQWIGYYRLDGSPMRFALRSNPTHTNVLYITLNLDQPLPPGSTQIVFRAYESNVRLRPLRDGSLDLPAGRIPRTSGIAGAGVALPTGAELVRFNPPDGTKKTEGNTVIVYWLSTRLGTNPPPLSVEFKMK